MLDEKDRSILEELRQDAKKTTKTIAENTAIPRTTVHDRIHKMEQSGVIRRFTVDVDPRKLGLPLAALVLVSVVQHSWREVGDRLRRLPGVEWLALSTGSFDYVLLVRAPDVDHLRDVILDGLQSIQGVQSAQTLLLLDEPAVG